MRGDEEKCRAAGCSGFFDQTHRSQPIDPRFGPTSWPTMPRSRAAECRRRRCRCRGPRPQQPHDADPIYCTLPTEDAAFRGIAEEFSARLKEKLQLMRQAGSARYFDTEGVGRREAVAAWIETGEVAQTSCGQLSHKASVHGSM